MKTTRVAPLLVVALAAAPAFAGITTYPAAKVSIEAPAGWTTTIKGDQVTVAPAGGDVAASFVVVPAGAIDAASRAAGRSLANIITNMTVQDDQKTTVNGMKAEFVGGDGRLNGTNIDWMVAVFDTPATDKDLMVIVIAEDAKLAVRKPEVRYLFQHIRPATP
jgi:hypothetical protein